MAIGIFGGTFDPPHVGHLILAETCADALGLARVLWVPAADPPHKPERAVSPAAQRVTMVEIAIAGNPRFSLSCVDVERPGPHYSADMAQRIAAQHPGAALYFLMGSDSLHDLPTWHDPTRLLTYCKLAVMRRPSDGLDLHTLYTQLPMLEGAIHFVDAPPIGISSTEVRRRVQAGWSIRYYVPDSVAEYVASEGLYSK